MDKLAALAILLTVATVIYFFSPKSQDLQANSQLVDNHSQVDTRSD